ncbi:MAG: hypothetical protein AW07_02459 [Candidatus Accumulibacter sp. SK-11]|nr:MAG: hypothetical protein AW07_02459 [Candidatus Accumulibacter sp. SK-11]
MNNCSGTRIACASATTRSAASASSRRTRAEMLRVISGSSSYEAIRSGSWVRKRALTYEVMKKLPNSRRISASPGRASGT